ncbi:MAG: aromatic ring-hydroxylating dioxygenase subunit alpha [Candidatus Sericytochromatia bacterium]|nr:aromatic ring-hydroxylating dioxygenase subunit alpha [Candidatus Tanganyikabacteria bacterium]
MDGTLRDHWYAACTTRQLGRKRPRAIRIMGESLVVWRDAAGEPIVFLDRCLHRNAQLSEGDLFDGCIGCPYHGWTYDRDGYCVNVPSEGPARRSPGADRRIRRFPATERDGLVWVYMGAPSATSQPPPMPYYRTQGWRAYYMTTHFRNNVTNLAENFMDVPHTVFVHRRWFRNRRKVEGEAIVKRTATSVELTYLHRDDIGFADWALNPDRLPMIHTDKFFMPNVTRVDYQWGDSRNFVISSQITPVADLESMVYTCIAFRFGALTPLLEPFFRWYTRQVIEQDVRIMDNQSRNLRRYPAEFRGTAADIVHEYIESLREHAELGEDSPPPAPEERRVSFWI